MKNLFVFIVPFIFGCSTTNSDIERIQRNMAAAGRRGSCLEVVKQGSRVYSINDVCVKDKFSAEYRCSPTLIGQKVERIGTVVYMSPKYIETCKFLIKELRK